MAHQVPWNKENLREFAELAMLNEREVWVMRTRVAGMCRTEQARTLNISVETLDRMIRKLKQKYDKVQPISKTLPPRKFSAKEVWMDTH